jgi:hypothetical protein
MHDLHPDQATGLRKMFRTPSVRVLPVLGTAGDATRVLRLAGELANTGERVLVIDQSNRDVANVCRIVPDGTLADLVRGEAEFDTVAPMTEAGYRVMIAGQGFDVACGQGVPPSNVYSALAELPEPIDIVIVHIVHAHRLEKFVDRVGDCLMITGANEAAVASAYQSVKHAAQSARPVQVVIDGVPTQDEAMRTYRRIATTAERFLGVVPRFAGWLPAESMRNVMNGLPNSGNTKGGVQRVFSSLVHAISEWRLAEYAFAQPSAYVAETATEI